jgi:hypothetical protein
MREISRRERTIPDTRTQVITFVRTALPPLIARYAFQIMKAATALPQVRAILLALAIMAAAFLIVPAVLIGILAFLATGDTGTATASALTVTVLAGAVLGVLIAKLYKRWQAFRHRVLTTGR